MQTRPILSGALGFALTLGIHTFAAAQISAGGSAQVQIGGASESEQTPTESPTTQEHAQTADAQTTPSTASNTTDAQPTNTPAGESTTTPGNIWGRAVYGVRLAYAQPAGGLFNDVPISDWITGGLQFQLDLNFKLDHSWRGGFSLGLTFPGTSDELVDGCGDYSHECSAFGIELGVQGEHHLQPMDVFDPWFGGSIAIEGLIINETGPMTDISLSLTGPNFGLSAGADFRLGGLSIGPFVSYKLGWFGSVSVDYGGYGSRGEVEDTSLHHWFIFGVRGAFTPWSP